MFDLAIYYRMVGGFIGTGSTTLGRLRWAVTMGCYMAFVSVVHHQQALVTGFVFVACLLGAFLGRLIPHARFQATASLLNSLGMAAVNVARLVLIVGPYAVTFHDGTVWMSIDRMSLALLGVLAGVAYYVGNKWLGGKDSGIYFRNTHAQWRINPTTSVPTAVPVDPACILDQAAVGGSEWGELCTGWMVYELMFLAALVVP
jgi:hypothetical protein